MALDLLSIASNQLEFPDPTQVPDGQRAFVEWQSTFTPEMVLALVEFYESWSLDEHCELCGGPQRDGKHTERCVVSRIRKLSEGEAGRDE